MSEYFDYEKVAREAGISPEDLEKLRHQAMDDYRGDMMMAELRLLRTCRAIRRGRCTVAEALAPEDNSFDALVKGRSLGS